MGRERTDEDLLRARDPEAFGEFYRRHVDAVLAYFARRTSDHETAADLTAETFAAALLARHRFRPGGPPARAWLFAIAHNKLVDWARRGSAEDRARRRLAMERIELTPDDRVEIDALQHAVFELVEDLPGDQRDAVRARVVRELDYSDIADRLQVSEAVVRKRVSRGLAGLRERLRPPR